MRNYLRFLWPVLVLAALILSSCTPSPGMTSTPTPPSAERHPCGDSICEGPENPSNCPEDCQQDEGQQISPAPGNTCLEPNPRRAVISEDLLGWYSWLEDGGFEQGSAAVTVSGLPQGGLKLGSAERSQQAARTGSWGYEITTGADEGLIFSLQFSMEKGENTRFSIWARSTSGNTSLKPTVEGLDFIAGTSEATPIYISDQEYPIGEEWTQVMFETTFAHASDSATFSLAIPPNTSIYLDDAAVEFPQWKTAEYPVEHLTIGGIPVPSQIAAPVHINFLIHIEDPNELQDNEVYFQKKTAVFRELARVFHNHGGFLTIQPEEDWVMAANQYAPETLKDFVQDYGVVYSTHTHGPHCRDDQGRLRSSSDCNANLDTPGWDQTITDYTYPEVVEYVRNLSSLISDAAGIPVTDHNGNWEFDQANRFSEIPMYTRSAYKAWQTQETYDYLINNPWRPSEANADTDIESFLTHNPDNKMIYIPGWGQAITRHPERLLTRLGPILSQFIYYADPERVNSFYVVLHVDHFYSRTGDPEYLSYDPGTGQVVYSLEFQQHISYIDEMLTKLIDPLVQSGYLQWTSLPEIGALYQQWESDCGETAPTTQEIKTPSAIESSYEPPINIALILHVDPSIAPDTTTFQATPEIYARSYDEIDWLMAEAARHHLQFTILYNGWFTQWALKNGDLDQFRNLLADGHEIGSHAHRIIYDPQEDVWIPLVDVLNRYGQPQYDAELAKQSWADADRFLDMLLQQIDVSGQNRTMCAVPFKCSDEGLLMSEYGFEFASGNRSEKGTSYFGHTVWNPWRPAALDIPGQELAEDLSADFIAIDHYAQIGSSEAHGMDLSVPHLQSQFLMLYTEWLSRVHRGAEDKVWTFGFVYHPNYGDKYNADLVEFLDWLDENFVGKTTPDGYTIARFATVSVIGQEYLDWEADHPGISSFNYQSDGPYPYTYYIIPEMMQDAAYVGELSMGSGVSCYQFTRNGRGLYLIWSNSGNQTIDFSSTLVGQVHLTDSSGIESTQDASALPITDEPLFVEE
jgi:hypothetical protein